MNRGFRPVVCSLGHYQSNAVLQVVNERSARSPSNAVVLLAHHHMSENAKATGVVCSTSDDATHATRCVTTQAVSDGHKTWFVRVATPSADCDRPAPETLTDMWSLSNTIRLANTLEDCAP